MSISALGSVYGKKLGRNRTRDVGVNISRTNASSVPLRSASEMPSPTTSAFHLREHRGVRQVEIVAAVDAAGHDDPDRRLVRLHVADLHRRGMRAQQRPAIVGPAALALDRRRQIQRVLHVARGMLGRHVQRVEAVPLVLDLGTFDDREAHAREDVFHAIAHDGQRMPVAERRAAARQRDVDGVGGGRRRPPSL